MNARTTPAHALAAALLALSVGGCDGLGQEQPADAASALAQNRWHDAARALAAELDRDPGNAELARQRVDALLALGDGEGAAAAIRRLGEVKPEVLRDPQWQWRAAEADIWRGQARQALDDLSGASGPDAARLRALALSTLDRYDEAREELIAALAHYPADARLNADMATRLIADGNLPAAREHVDAALRADPKSMDARFAGALLAEAASDLASARKQLDAIAADFPDNRTARLAQARVLLAMRKPEDAARITAALRESGLGVPALAVLEARIAAHQGRWDDVRSTMQASERELRNDPDAQVLYAAALIKLGQHATAQAILDRTVARDPDYIPARAQLVELLLQMGQPERARDAAAPLRALEPPPAPVRELLARVDAA